VVTRSTDGTVRHRAGMDCRGRWRKRATPRRRASKLSAWSRALHSQRSDCCTRPRRSWQTAQ